MTILFFGFLAVVFLNEIEELLKQNRNFDFRYVIRFPVARQSFSMIAGFCIFGLLFVVELWLLLSGKIHYKTPVFEGIVRAAIIIAISFLAIGYKIVCQSLSASDVGNKKIDLIKKLLIIFGAVLLVVFLILQFKLIYR